MFVLGYLLSSFYCLQQCFKALISLCVSDPPVSSSSSLRLVAPQSSEQTGLRGFVRPSEKVVVAAVATRSRPHPPPPPQSSASKRERAGASSRAREPLGNVYSVRTIDTHGQKWRETGGESAVTMQKEPSYSNRVCRPRFVKAPAVPLDYTRVPA